MNTRIRSASFVLALTLCVGVAPAETKRPLTHKDYDGWRSITSQQLSRDGKFLAYGLFPQEGDGEVVVRNLATNQEWREPAGARPQPVPRDPATAPEDAPPLQRNVRIAFTSDLQQVVFSTFPSKAGTDKARKEKKRPEEMPKDGLVILDLSSGAPVRIPSVKSFQVPEKGAGYIAYLKEAAPGQAAPEDKNNETAADDQDQRRAPQGGARPAARGGRDFGAELVLRKLADGSEHVFADVLDYSLTKDAQTLLYAVSSRKTESNGVYTAVPGSDAAPAALLNGKGKYSKLTWDFKQTQLVFLSDRDDDAAKQPQWKLYTWDRRAPAATELVSNSTPGLRQGYQLGDRGTMRFSRDGSRLFLQTAPPRAADRDAEADPAPADEKASADLWHWKDDHIQPMQKVRAEQDRNRSYLAVWHVAAKKLAQLGGPEMAVVTPNDQGTWAFGIDDREYRPLVEYDERYSDIYLTDTTTGASRLVAKKHRGTPQWSPDGRYGLLFDGHDWSALSPSGGAAVNLTAKLGVNFWNEDHDSPGTPNSYGTAGFTRDGKWALLYDRFDVWQLAPDGSSARNLTGGAGRREQVRLRAVAFADESDEDAERGIDPAEPLLLRAENLNTRDTGFYRVKIGDSAAPEKLAMAARNFGTPQKAKEAGTLLLTGSAFPEFPNLYVSDLSMKQMRKVTDANPQQAQLLWGTSELVRFKNTDGVPLTAALYKPENLDPKKKYPMVVYIYERLSQGLHNFVDPRPGHSINISYYVSNGYLVLEPDIVYTIGYPGQSALKCVLPAIQAVVDRGIVDENTIGIQGHSWGGYQIAYMVTQTTRFRAAAAGAPVANMISAYDGIRWGPGLPRQFQYERTQSRIGGSLWQYPSRFIENSPIFMADRVRTPLLLLHNDNDDAVPWYQGIEYYLALRRLGREVYLFTYNGEPHGLRRRPNQKDYTIRLQQFFDHYLKGAPMPEWMEKGIPYLDREQEKERLRAVADK